MKPKIWHIITSINNGGAENHLIDLIMYQKKYYDIFVIYFKGNSFYKKKLIANGIKVIYIPFKNKNIFLFIKTFLKLLLYFNKYKPEIIHCHLWISEIYGFFLKFIYKKNFLLVITKHLDSFIFEGSFGKKRILNGILLEKIILNYCDHVIFISNAVKNYFLKKIKINKKKNSKIYYGINTKKFYKISINDKKKYRKKLNIDQATFVIGCIARHVEQKNLEVVIKSFAKFIENNSNIKSKLIMIGKGHLETKLKKLANNLMLKTKIVWIKNANIINNYYNIFDISCLSSKYEGLGLVLMESVISGVPVLATRTGAIPELIKNGRSGFLVPPDDINNFSKKFIDTWKLRKSKNFKKERQKFFKLFCLEKSCKRIHRIYQNLLSKKYD